MKREITCINCPVGCILNVTVKYGEVVSVTGNTCDRGDAYGRAEVTAPVRIVTSSISVSGGERDIVAVKTAEAIPKGKIGECIKAIADVRAKAPVKAGDILIDNVAGTGINVIATANVEAGK